MNKLLLDQRRSQGFPVGKPPTTRSRPNSEKIWEKNWPKMGENNRRMSKNEEIYLSYPPEVESLATPMY